MKTTDLPTMLAHYADVLCGDDVRRIAAEADHLLSSIGQSSRIVAVHGRPDPDDTSTTPRNRLVCTLQRVRFVEPPAVKQKCAVIFAHPHREDPWLVAWEGEGPPPPLSIFRRGGP